MIKINKENVKKREQQLIHFKGFVPIDFLKYIDNFKRYDYLEQVGIYEKVQEDNHNFKVAYSKHGLSYKEKVLNKKSNFDVYNSIIKSTNHYQLTSLDISKL